MLYCLLNIAKDRPERRSFLYGRSEVIRTPGILLPNQARYQLRYTRIFNFCHYTTAREKIKDFSVCGHSCGQNRFCAVFGDQRKTSKRRRCKALRRFASPYPGYNHGTPKAVYIIPYDDLCRFPAISSRLRILFKTLISTVSAHSTAVCSQTCGQKPLSEHPRGRGQKAVFIVCRSAADG